MRLNVDEVCVTTAIADCDVNWQAHSVDGETRCYKNFGFNTADQAVSICTSEEAQLLNPRNAKELEDLNDLLGNKLNTNTWVMLNGTDAENEGTWTTFSGEPINFFKWYGNEPNGNEDENCMFLSPEYGMIDRNCFANTDVICQKSKLLN